MFSLPGFTMLSSSNAVRLGIDLGAHSLKLVQLQVLNNKIKILDAELLPLPAKENGVPASKSASKIHFLKPTIKEWKASKRLRTPSVYVAMESTSTQWKEIKLPRLPEEELKKGIQWQAEKHLTLPVKDCLVDFQILERSGGEETGEMTVIFVAALKEDIKSLALSLKGAGLNPQRIDVGPFAFAKAVSKIYAKDKTVAALDIGAAGTFISIISGEKMHFLRHIDIGGNKFTQTIAKRTDKSEEEAEQLKISSDPAQKEQIKSAINYNLTDLVQTIDQSVLYFKQKFPQHKIDKMILSGSSVTPLGLREALAKQIDLDIEIANVLAQVDVDSSLKHKAADLGPLLMTAVGAAL